jgi:uncharacterized peroxidase-related enzyme
VTHHRRGLRRLLRDDDLAEAIEADFETAAISEKRKEMLRYAVKLTLTPSEIVESDIARLRKAGFADIDILHIVEVTVVLRLCQQGRRWAWHSLGGLDRGVSRPE